MLFIFSTPVSIRHMWQLKTVVHLHWCLIRAVQLFCYLSTHSKKPLQLLLLLALRIGREIIASLTRHHDTQHNDIQHNDIKHNDIQQNNK